MDFKDHLRYVIDHGIARSNRFQVLIPLPPFMQKKTVQQATGQLSLDIFGVDVGPILSAFLGADRKEVTRGLDIMCDQTDLPGKSFTTSDVKYNGDFYKLPNTVVYSLHNFNFHPSEDMYEKNLIDAWMSAIININTQEIMYYEDFTTDITINMMDTNDRVVYTAILKDAYPIYNNPITLNHGEKDMAAIMMVQFAYRKWFRAGEQQTNNTGLNRLSQTALGQYLTPILSNPVVAEALNMMKDRGIDLEGDALEYYKMADNIVQNTTGTSINHSVGLLNGMIAQIKLSDNITGTQAADLLRILDDTVRKLKG